jgi:hypothetical protein
MDPDDVSQGNGEQTVRIVVAQVLLHGERQAAQVLEGADVVVIEL